MVKNARLLGVLLLVFSNDAFGMDFNDKKSIGTAPSCLTFNHACLQEKIRTRETIDTTNTTLALPALDVISYCRALDAAQKKLAKNPYALHNACVGSNLERVKLLVAAGASLEMQDYFRDTPLDKAVGNIDHPEIAKFLLQRNALIYARNYRRTPLHILASYPCLPKWPIKSIKTMAELLLEYNIPVDAQDLSDMTPLHHASLTGNKELAELLLSHDADVDAQDTKQQTPLHLAVSYGHQETIEILLDYGAVIDARNARGRTPLTSVAGTYKNRKAIAQLLINRGASVNIQDYDNTTPLHFAVRNNYKDLIELFLDHHALVDTQNSEGATPLHEVVRIFKEGAELLLSKAFFLPAIQITSINSTASLQELSLVVLLKHLDAFDKDSLTNSIIPCIADHLAINPARNNVLQILVDQAPLNIQQACIKFWKRYKSDENDNKIKFFLAAHSERHGVKIKNVVAIKNNKEKTARDIAQRDVLADMVTLLDNVAGAQKFSDLDPKLQAAIKQTIEKDLLLSD